MGPLTVNNFWTGKVGELQFCGKVVLDGDYRKSQRWVITVKTDAIFKVTNFLKWKFRSPELRNGLS